MIKYVKVLSLLIIVSILVSSYPNSAAVAALKNKAIQVTDTEIQRAISYGFVPDNLQSDLDKTVTFSQFSTMIKDMLTLYDSKLVPQWKKTASLALKSKDTMHRDHGMLTVYFAACLMGIGQTTNGNWNYINEKLGVGTGDVFDWDYAKWFPDYDKKAPFYDIEYKKHISGWSYDTCSRLWCLGQTSCVSGNPIFDIDYKKKTVRPMLNLSRKEAIQAVLRLYESTLMQKEKASGRDKRSVKILTLADNRRTSILSSEITIVKSDIFIQGKTYTGTAYYVSNSGDDSNDGTSLSTPWASMSKVNSVELNHGDVVFFNRGDIWYDTLCAQQGVTYSAYGTGSKPVISGSVPENAAASNLWNLFYKGKKGEKIWVYNRDLRDASGIFFDNGERWANKVMPCWDGRQYVSDKGKKFDVVTGLTKDLDFFSCVDLSMIKPFEQVNSTGVTGPLYLRCDAGNPGTIYSRIDFSQDGMGVSPLGTNGKDLTIDNISIVFFGALGVDCRGYLGWTKTMVQNCEIGWCGGGITNYSYLPGNNRFAYAATSGGAVHMAGPQKTAVNNYIHHCASKSFVIAIHDRPSASPIYSDILIQGNLLEYNAAALHLVNYMEQENPTVDSGFKNVSFSDNYVMYTGYGWVDTMTQRTDLMLEKIHSSAIEFGGEYLNKNGGIFIKNNIFYLSKYTLVHCFMPKDNQPVFSGNIYAQGENGWLAMLRGRLLSITENGYKNVRNELLDQTGSVLIVQ